MTATNTLQAAQASAPPSPRSASSTPLRRSTHTLDAHPLVQIPGWIPIGRRNRPVATTTKGRR
jgi:hypothetical protein